MIVISQTKLTIVLQKDEASTKAFELRGKGVTQGFQPDEEKMGGLMLFPAKMILESLQEI
jgi:hypothetical protein